MSSGMKHHITTLLPAIPLLALLPGLTLLGAIPPDMWDCLIDALQVTITLWELYRLPCSPAYRNRRNRSH